MKFVLTDTEVGTAVAKYLSEKFHIPYGNYRVHHHLELTEGTYEMHVEMKENPHE